MARARSLALPYDRAIKAMAYAGYTFEKICDVLESLRFLVNRAEPRLLDIYKKYKKEARKLNRDFLISAADINSLALDPVFSWAQSLGDPRVCPQSKWMHRIADEMQHPNLRKQLDILIFLGHSPEEIAELLVKASTKKPVPKWTYQEVYIYRDFFWNPEHMSIQDWQDYVDLADPKYRLKYIAKLTSMTVDELLSEASVPITMTPREMAEAMMRDMYMEFQKAMTKGDRGNIEHAIQALTAFKALYAVNSRVTETSKVKEAEIDKVLNNVRVLMHGEKAEDSKIIPISEIDIRNVSNPNIVEEKITKKSSNA